MSPQNEIFRHRKWGESLETLFLPTFHSHILTREGDWGWGCSTKWGILQLQPSNLMSAKAVAVKNKCVVVWPPILLRTWQFFHFFWQNGPQNEILRHRKWGESLETLFLATFHSHILTREGDWGWGCSIKWGILQLQPSNLMSATAKEVGSSSVLAHFFTSDMANFAPFLRKWAPKMRYLGTGSGGRVLRLCFCPHFEHIFSQERGIRVRLAQ